MEAMTVRVLSLCALMGLQAAVGCGDSEPSGGPVGASGAKALDGSIGSSGSNGSAGTASSDGAVTDAKPDAATADGAHGRCLDHHLHAHICRPSNLERPTDYFLFHDSFVRASRTCHQARSCRSSTTR